MTATLEDTASEVDAPASPAETKAEAKRAAAAQRAALADLTAPVRGRVRVAMVMQIVASAATVAPYAAIAELGTSLTAHGPIDHGRVWTAVWLVVAALVVRTVFGSGALIVSHFADVALQAILRRRIVATLGALPLGWFTRNSSGRVRKATQNDVAELHYLVAHQNVETVAAIATPLLSLVYLCWLDWQLALLAIVTLPIYAVVYAVLAKDTGTRMTELSAGLAAISSTIVEFVGGIAVVKTYGRAGQAHSRYSAAAADFGKAYDDWTRPMLSTQALASIVLSAPVILLVNLLGGLWFVHSGWVGVINLVTAALVAMALPTVVVTLSYGMGARKQAAGAAARIAGLLQEPTLPSPPIAVEPTGNDVVFEGVSFSHDGVARALDGVDLTLPAGTVTALVGRSGSGKSTLATLLPRFQDPDAGTVRLGGVDLRDIDPATLYRHVSFVLQQVQLLNESVLDNIRLARPDATLDQVRAAAAAARIDERIIALPRGYDSVVGRDAKLSGGEAQRVSIARALLADTPVLVLDEATAYADPECEAEIQQALSALSVGRTVLVIAHRLETIVGAHQIVVLDRGRVVERGTHTDLLDRDGVYARMWRLQHGGTAL